MTTEHGARSRPPLTSRELLAARIVLSVAVLVLVPAYLYFLFHMGTQWVESFPPDDSARTLLPVAVPLAAFSITTFSAISWWWSLERGREVLLGRKGCRKFVVFAAALSALTVVCGASSVDVGVVLLSLGLTGAGMTGLWFLPAALSPTLLNALPERNG
jgi:hypothetical protein